MMVAIHRGGVAETGHHGMVINDAYGTDAVEM